MNTATRSEARGQQPVVRSKRPGRLSLVGRLACAFVLAATAVCASPSPSLQAQEAPEWDAAREQMTRDELEELLVELESQAESSAYSQRLREHARQSAEMVRTRLREGDFQVGDQVVLEIENEPELSDTLIVRSGRIVNIPVVGELSLDGVLRSELQEHVADHIATFVRDPVVHTEALIRISVHGEVGEPGFYVLPADRLVDHALMIAGGPTGTAKLTEMRIERGGARIWEGEELEMAIVQGRTLDQLNVQAGDRIVVPLEQQRDGWEVMRVVAMTVGSVVSLGFALTRIF